MMIRYLPSGKLSIISTKERLILVPSVLFFISVAIVTILRCFVEDFLICNQMSVFQ